MANSFNPDPFKGTTQDQGSFLGRSKGRSAAGVEQGVANTKVIVDDSTSQTLAGVAKLGLDVVGITDREFQAQQRREFQADHDDIQNEFGVREATTIETRSGAGAPKDIQNAQGELERMSKARQAGQLKESAYWARLNSVVRQMRARWPGYRDQIDSMVSGITGATPANALRSTLQKERDAAARALKSSQGRLSRQHEKADFRLANLGVPVRGRDQLSIQQKLDLITKYQQSEANVRRATAQLTFARQRNALKQDQASTVVGQALSVEYSKLSEAFFNQDFNERISELKRLQASGQSVSSADIGKIRGDIEKAKTTMLGQLQVRVNSFIKKGLINADEAQKQYRFFEGQLNSMTESLSKGDWASFDYNHNLVKSIENKNVADLVKNNPSLGNLTAMRNVMGDQLFATWAVDNLPGVQRVLKDAGSSLVITQKLPMNQVVRKMKADGAESKTIQNMMVQKARALQGGANDETVSAIATSVFGNQSSDLLDEVAPKDRYRIWNMYANEAVSENLWKQRDKNPEVWKNYRSWMIDNGRNLIRRLAPDTKDALINRSFLSVDFNKQTGQFVIKDKNGGTGGVTASLERYVESGWLRQQDVSTFNKLNEVSRNMSRLFKLEGEDAQAMVSQFIANTLQQFGTNPDSDSEGNWLVRHYQRIAERSKEMKEQGTL